MGDITFKTWFISGFFHTIIIKWQTCPCLKNTLLKLTIFPYLENPEQPLKAMTAVFMHTKNKENIVNILKLVHEFHTKYMGFESARYTPVSADPAGAHPPGGLTQPSLKSSPLNSVCQVLCYQCMPGPFSPALYEQMAWLSYTRGYKLHCQFSLHKCQILTRETRLWHVFMCVCGGGDTKKD